MRVGSGLLLTQGEEQRDLKQQYTSSLSLLLSGVKGDGTDQIRGGRVINFEAVIDNLDIALIIIGVI